LKPSGEAGEDKTDHRSDEDGPKYNANATGQINYAAERCEEDKQEDVYADTLHGLT